MARRSQRVLTREQEIAIRKAIAEGATDDEARRAAGISARLLYAARNAELADLPRNKRGPRPGRVYKPHPDFQDLPVEEIYRRAAALRSERWSEEEQQRRWNPRFSPQSDA